MRVCVCRNALEKCSSAGEAASVLNIMSIVFFLIAVVIFWQTEIKLKSGRAWTIVSMSAIVASFAMLAGMPGVCVYAGV